MNSIAGYSSKICKIYKHLLGTLKRSKKGLKFIGNYIYGKIGKEKKRLTDKNIIRMRKEKTLSEDPRHGIW